MYSAVLAAALFALTSNFSSPASFIPISGAFIRLNQVGYADADAKVATVLSIDKIGEQSFEVVNAGTGQVAFTGSLQRLPEEWNPRLSYVYRLDFSRLQANGKYYVRLPQTGAASPLFSIGSARGLYRPLVGQALYFFGAQRDGRMVDSSIMGRRPSHLSDEHASGYEPPHYRGHILQSPLQRVEGSVDVSGGWMDAGDDVKFVETTSYVEGLMLTALRDHPSLRLVDDNGRSLEAEARFGLDWLLKMWDQRTLTLYYQVGLCEGNQQSVLGCHDLWRLPEQDDDLNVRPGDPLYFIRYRPVFRCGPPGSPISPNLAGRMAASLALAAQVEYRRDPALAHRCLLAAETIFDLAQTTGVGELTTVSPHEEYPEQEWRDDMEWGAVELFLAVARTRSHRTLPHPGASFYLKQASHWAHEYLKNTRGKGDSLNLYDVSALAHYDLCRALLAVGYSTGVEVTRHQLVADLKSKLLRGMAAAAADPFRLATPYTSQDVTPHAMGYAVEARLYQQLTGNDAFLATANRQRDWVLGDNAWGESFVVGAGATYPEHIHHQTADLSRRADGGSFCLLGAVVDGPSSPALCRRVESMAQMSAPGLKTWSCRTAVFDREGVCFQDRTPAWPCVEPADDYTALSILLFAQQCDSTVRLPRHSLHSTWFRNSRGLEKLS